MIKKFYLKFMMKKKSKVARFFLLSKKFIFRSLNFQGKIKLRMKKEFLFFEGEAEIVSKVREKGRGASLQSRKKIKILKPEIKKENKEETKTQEFLAEIPKNLEKEKFSPEIVAILNSIFCALMILILKIKLKSSKINH